jgi:hypothetical protein
MATIADLSDPLSDEELERLQTILLDRVDEDAVTDGKDEGVLDISELDGFLTAVVSGPVTILPSRWLPAVWGDFEPTWDSLDDYGAFMSMLMRHMNSIAETLIEEPEAFEPMYLEHLWKGKAVLVVDEWCEGYMRTRSRQTSERFMHTGSPAARRTHRPQPRSVGRRRAWDETTRVPAAAARNTRNVVCSSSHRGRTRPIRVSERPGERLARPSRIVR